jgi:hypothetical protein
MIISSPCTGVCQLNPGGICVGCFRSKDEIAGWTQMNDREKSSVNAVLDIRRKIGTASGNADINPSSSVFMRS